MFRVLELGSNISAPLAGTILGDLGYDVIKVEPPKGDDRRAIPPFKEGASVYFSSVNRNKRSVVVDLRRSEGVEVFRKLASTSDVVLTNYRPRALKKLHIDYDSVLEVNPRVVYCSITGYGGTDEPAYDATILAESGLMDLTGEPDRPPVKFATSISDVTTALTATVLVLHSLLTGRRPVFLDVSMIHTQLYLILEDAYALLNVGLEPRRTGSSHRFLVPYQAFQAADGYVYVSVFNDEQYTRLCEALGREDLKVYKTQEERLRNRDKIVGDLQEVFRRNNRDYWVSLLKAYDVPCASVRKLREALEIYGKSMVREVRGIKYLSFPSNVSRGVELPSPRLGEHTVDVLKELGYTQEEIGTLIKEGVVMDEGLK